MQDMVLLTMDVAIGFLKVAVAIKEANDWLVKLTSGLGILDVIKKPAKLASDAGAMAENAFKHISGGAGFLETLAKPTKLLISGGAALVDGIAAGVDSKTPSLMAKMEGLGPPLAGAFDKGIDRHSPSKLFRTHAQDIPRGVALGIEDESPRVSSAIAAMASVDDMQTEGSTGGRGGNGGGHGDVYISSINIDARGSSPDDMKNSHGLREALVEVLEDAVRQSGLRVVRFR